MQYVHIYNDARGLMMCPNMSIKMERLLHGDNQNIGKEHNKGEVAICLLLLFLYGYRQAGNVIRTMSQVTEVHKIAITFDDDVIIGLSQEISCKEASA